MITGAFAGIPGVAQESPVSRWDLTLCETPVVARQDEPWLVMTAPVAGSFELSALPARNAGLPGLVKFALSADGEPEIRAEIPLDEEAAPLIREALRGFERAFALVRGGECEPPPGEASPAVSQDDLKRLCAEAGWACTPRGDNSCAVELECPGAFLQASLAPRGDGLRVSVQLASCDKSAADPVSALSILFLKTGAAVRMARPVFETNEGRVHARFEVTFSAVPSPAQLAHALSALSVAAQLCAEEAGALQEPDLVREFLAMSKTKTRKEKP
jgi:hypothetical protein